MRAILLYLLISINLFSQQNRNVILSPQNLTYSKINDQVSVATNTAYTYTGTVRTVGSGKTYSTLTSAYSAAASGDIIEVYGTINLASESGGYWLINTAKNVLVRGSSTDATQTILTLTTSASFAVRVRVNSGIVIKDLTIYTNQNVSCIYNDADEVNRSQVCENVRFIQDGTGASSVWFSSSGTNTVQTRYYEFKNCYFERLNNSSTIALNITLPSANNTFLFTNCHFNHSGIDLVRIHQTFTGKVIFYNSTFIQKSSHIICQFGMDTSIPTATIGVVDFRNNKLIFENGSAQHGILLGRGTDSVYCVNNTIRMTSTYNALAIGIVLKTTSSSVGKSLITGNYIEAPRPLYIKGGSKIKVVNNTFISNNISWESFGFTNHKNGADEVLSRSNVITDNTFFGNTAGIYCYNTGAAETDVVSLKTCTLERNKYYISRGVYLTDQLNATNYNFTNKSTFWGSSNDYSSSIIAKENFPVIVK